MTHHLSSIKVAVVTPYSSESVTQLLRCYTSVRSQIYPSTHIFVADGSPSNIINDLDCHHVILPCSHHDIGSTPRLIGAIHAIGLGFDVIAFLDADNWYRNDHISSLVSCHINTKADFVSTSRFIVNPYSQVVGVCPITNPYTFIDTSCMCFFRNSFPLLHHWVTMPPYGHLIGDRIILYYLLNSGLNLHHTGLTTVYYTCNKPGIYNQLGIPVPEGCVQMPDYQSSFNKWTEEGNSPLL